MRTILHICDWYAPGGGAEKLLFDTILSMERIGCRNIIAYNDQPNQQPTGSRAEYACIGLETLDYSQPEYPQMAAEVIARLQEIIATHKPDLCHIHNFQNAMVTESLVKTLPCVRSIHDPRLYCFRQWKLLPDGGVCPHPLGPKCVARGCLSKGIKPKTRLDRNAKWVYRHFWAHRKMPVLIAESRSQIESLLQNGFRPDQIAWLPNFTSVKPKAETLKFVEHHWDDSKNMVLAVGRAVYEKGLQILIEAYPHIKSQAEFVIITRGEYLETLRRKAAPHTPGVTVIPGVSYEVLRTYYAAASLVVVPSVWLEPFGLVGLEAYAHMKPVIGSRIGGIKDWLVDGKTGWFFEPGNPIDLAQKIDLALADKERLASMGRAAYDRAAAYYNQEIYLSRLQDIYQRAIDRFTPESKS